MYNSGMNADRLSRRRFVLGSLLVGAAGPGLWISSAAQAAFEPPIAPDDPIAGGTLLTVVPFLGESFKRLGKLYSHGLNARLVVDLKKLNSKTLVMPNESFFVRTGSPEGLSALNPWRVRVSGQQKDRLQFLSRR